MAKGPGFARGPLFEFSSVLNPYAVFCGRLVPGVGVKVARCTAVKQIAQTDFPAYKKADSSDSNRDRGPCEQSQDDPVLTA